MITWVKLKLSFRECALKKAVHKMTVKLNRLIRGRFLRSKILRPTSILSVEYEGRNPNWVLRSTETERGNEVEILNGHKG